MNKPTKKLLVWQDPSTRGVLKSTVISHFAMWAVRQSPYLYPAELRHGIEEFNTALDYGSENYCETTCNDLKADICTAISKSDTIKAWNVPKVSKVDGAIWVTRGSNPIADHDIIDLHALSRNIAHSVWLETCYDDGFFNRLH